MEDSNKKILRHEARRMRIDLKRSMDKRSVADVKQLLPQMTDAVVLDESTGRTSGVLEYVVQIGWYSLYDELFLHPDDGPKACLMCYKHGLLLVAKSDPDPFHFWLRLFLQDSAVQEAIWKAWSNGDTLFVTLLCRQFRDEECLTAVIPAGHQLSCTWLLLCLLVERQIPVETWDSVLLPFQVLMLARALQWDYPPKAYEKQFYAFFRLREIREKLWFTMVYGRILLRNDTTANILGDLENTVVRFDQREDEESFKKFFHMAFFANVPNGTFTVLATLKGMKECIGRVLSSISGLRADDHLEMCRKLLQAPYFLATASVKIDPVASVIPVVLKNETDTRYGENLLTWESLFTGEQWLEVLEKASKDGSEVDESIISCCCASIVPDYLQPHLTNAYIGVDYATFLQTYKTCNVSLDLKDIIDKRCIRSVFDARQILFLYFEADESLLAATNLRNCVFEYLTQGLIITGFGNFRLFVRELLETGELYSTSVTAVRVGEFFEKFLEVYADIPKFMDYIDSLPEEEIKVLRQYHKTSMPVNEPFKEFSYTTTQRQLTRARRRPEPYQHKRIQLMDSIAKKVPRTTKPLVAWRGLSVPSFEAVNLDLDIFKSLSLSVEVSLHFLRESSCCLTRVLVPPGVPLISIPPAEGYEELFEFVLPRGARFKSTGVSVLGDRTIYECQVVFDATYDSHLAPGRLRTSKKQSPYKRKRVM